ncbi:MAG: type IV toxin-antitoxin system AbiEi family antitoxin domain-containing protein [Kineosporiaceae bacterium]
MNDARPAKETSGLSRVPLGVFRQSEAARAGVPPRTLYRMRDAGLLEVVGRGLYRRADAAPVDRDLLEIVTRAPDAILCLETALARHGLTDAIPSRIDVALPRGRSGPSTSAPAAWHYFDAATFSLGRQVMTVEGTDTTIGLYSAERCIADAFRLRGTVGYELALEALRAWLRWRDSHPARLMQLAEQLPRAATPLRAALEILA